MRSLKDTVQVQLLQQGCGGVGIDVYCTLLLLLLNANVAIYFFFPFLLWFDLPDNGYYRACGTW